MPVHLVFIHVGWCSIVMLRVYAYELPLKIHVKMKLYKSNPNKCHVQLEML